MTRAEAVEAVRNRPASPQDELLMRTVLSDEMARAVLAAWPLGGICDGWRPEELSIGGREGTSGSDAWDSLWDGIGIDSERVAMLSGFPPFAIERRIHQLIAARLVFPDGSVSSAAVDVALQAVRPSRRARTRRIGSDVVPEPLDSGGEGNLRG